MARKITYITRDHPLYWQCLALLTAMAFDPAASMRKHPRSSFMTPVIEKLRRFVAAAQNESFLYNYTIKSTEVSVRHYLKQYRINPLRFEKSKEIARHWCSADQPILR